MKTFKLEIECDNDAFADYPAREITRILQQVAIEINRSMHCNSAQWVRDSNGNRVGTYKYEVR